ncbi:NSS family neurotransmitter:Na+ symporter [Litorivivens lipolytica]|uniref:NSS family neurotransmitter:Na+ symporter n=1 Tax=Litorivivens lipolytica TaxID=1524264 RepID=A0A7W4W3M2_9GAMM|nr:sodium-dependent transporter [Litorivivens lipolytica]MBB3046836.1 NSS family neurotransmitter:Na+ symporter [Litorivivens lipolytica]
MQRDTLQGVWVSRWTFVAAASGLAIGLGNFWRFPHEVGHHGGLLYILAYLAFLLILATPVMLAEVVMGSRGRANPETAIQFLNLESGSRPEWRLVPVLAMVTGLLILVHMSVIAGWVSSYAYYLGDHKLGAISIEFAAEYFGDYVQSKEEMLKGFTGFILILLPLAMMRMTLATGQILRLLVPIILIALLCMAYAASQMGNFPAGLSWMLAVRPEDFGPDAIVSALGQAFYSLGIGVGAMMIYGAYFPDGRSISRQVGAVAIIDTVVALVAGISIYALVLDYNIEPGNSVPLLFISLPYVFGNLPFGDLLGGAFFILVGLVMLCSALALLEPALAWAVEKTPLPRWAAALGLVFAVWLAGVWLIDDVAAPGAATRLFFLNRLTSELLLPLSALGLALYAGWVLRDVQARDELYYCKPRTFWIWRILLRYIAPPAIVAVLILANFPQL